MILSLLIKNGGYMEGVSFGEGALLLTAQSPAGILSAGACIILTRVGINLICIASWQASICASSLKMSCAREATTGSNTIQITITTKTYLDKIHFYKNMQTIDFKSC